MTFFETTYLLLTAGILLSSFLLWKQNKTLASHKEYAKNHSVIETVYQDIVMLGASNSGKTSVSELWTKPWCDITRIKKSGDWNISEINIFRIGKEKRNDNTFQVEREYIKNLDVRIFDYPGDDFYKSKFIDNLPALNKAVLLLFFNLKESNKISDKDEIPFQDENDTYFSEIFLEKLIEKKNISQHVSKCIIVFNKIDLLPQNWNKNIMMEKLKSANKQAIKKIESVFSGISEFHMISAYDNRGLISLLGIAGSMALTTEQKLEYEKQMKVVFKSDSKKQDNNL